VTLFGEIETSSAPEKAIGPFAGVAMEQSVDKVLDYAIPPRLTAMLKVGQRVKVPLGRNNKPALGYVVSIRAESDFPKIKKLSAIDDDRALVDGKMLELARWMSRYYCAPLGAVIDSIIPAAVKKRVGIGYSQMVSLAKDRTAIQETLEKTKAPKRRAILARLLQLEPGTSIEIVRLAGEAGVTVATVRKLLRLGLIAIHSVPDIASLTADMEVSPAGEQQIALNEDQQKVFDQLLPRARSGGFSVNLIHGVTGSGKTEIYLQVISAIVEQGKQAVVLVPEIALTPQTVRRFTARFKRVAILHSGLSATQRHRYWQQILQGQADVVVGARSAIFAPVPNLGVIVVDEEHESSYKQDTSPRYHARDVAIKRAQIESVPVILGSATPSLETWNRANPGQRAEGRGQKGNTGTEDVYSSPPYSGERQGEGQSGKDEGGRMKDEARHPHVILQPSSFIPSVRAPHPASPPSTGERSLGAERDPVKSPYNLLALPNRVRGLKLPHVELVDMRTEAKLRRGVHLISHRLEHLLQHTMAEKHQAILLLNRRGYSNYIYCKSCSHVMQCKYCDATLTYHRNVASGANSAAVAESVHTGQLQCHYCLATNPLPAICPECGKKLSLFGMGTQRVEEELLRRIPNCRYARVDSDSMRGTRDYEKVLGQFARKELDVLLGTQMIAKGLDYPNVTLVGVISGDTALALPDFRAAERTFQLITQVAGRAGRGDVPGRVVLQTFLPDDPTIQAALKQDYVGFAKTELEQRKSVNLPPFMRMARIVMRDEDPEKLSKRSEEIAAQLNSAAAPHGEAVLIRGPMPCAIGRIAGYHRHQIVITSTAAARIQNVLATVREKGALARNERIAVDVDPVSLL
jgi:primosomal protein N' (replication factor Y)